MSHSQTPESKRFKFSLPTQVQPRSFLGLNAAYGEEDGDSVVNVVDQRAGEEEAEDDSHGSTSPILGGSPGAVHCQPKKELDLASLGNSHNSTPTTPNNNPFREPFPNFELLMKSPMAPLFFGAAFPHNPLLAAGITSSPAQNDFTLATMSMLHQTMFDKSQGASMFPPGHGSQVNRQEVNKNHLKRGALSGMARDGETTINGSPHHQGNHPRVLNNSSPPVPGAVAVANSPAAKLFSKDDWSWHRNPAAAIRSGGTNKQTPVWKYFVYSKAENLSRCVVADCTYMLKGPHTSTLACHLKKHQAEYAEFQRLKLEYTHERNSSQGSSERGTSNRKAGNNDSSPISPTSSTTSLSAETRRKRERSGENGAFGAEVAGEPSLLHYSSSAGNPMGGDAHIIRPNGIFGAAGCGLPLTLAGLPLGGFPHLPKFSNFPAKPPPSGNEEKGRRNGAEKPQQNNYTSMSDILSLLNARAAARARDGTDGSQSAGSPVTPSTTSKMHAEHTRHSKSSFRSVLDLASSSLPPNDSSKESGSSTDGTPGDEDWKRPAKPLVALSLALFTSGIPFDVMRNPLLDGFLQRNCAPISGHSPREIVEERLDAVRQSVIGKLAGAEGGLAVIVDVVSPAASMNSAISVACIALDGAEGHDELRDDCIPYFVGLLPSEPESEPTQLEILLQKLEKFLRDFGTGVAEKTRFVIAPGRVLTSVAEAIVADDEDCKTSTQFDNDQANRVLEAYSRKVRQVVEDFSAGSEVADTAPPVQYTAPLKAQQRSNVWAQLFISPSTTFRTGTVVENLVACPDRLDELSKVITLRFNRPPSDSP